MTVNNSEREAFGLTFNPFRVIPCLLMHAGQMVKTRRFRGKRYVGDILNSLRIFNEKEVDEIMVLDIEAARLRRPPDLALIREIASECFMPLAYGGGISTVSQVVEIISAGVEKVVLNTAALQSPELVEQSAKAVGRQSVVVSIDVKKTLFRGARVFTQSGTRDTNLRPQDAVRRMVDAGAGEILIHSIDRDGTLSGFDFELIKTATAAATTPVVAVGGAASVEDIVRAVHDGGASAVAAGAFFVFQGPHQAVLLSYPTATEVRAAVSRLRTA